jgi:epoxyqueuosine reductase
MLPIYELFEELKNACTEMGLETVSVLDLQSDPLQTPNVSSNLEKDRLALKAWLQAGAHGEMHFMEKNHAARRDASHILPQARTALVFLVPYSPGKNIRMRRSVAQRKNAGSLASASLLPKSSIVHKIARYARSKDYHKILKLKLEECASRISKNLALNFEFRAVVDSIPFFDRAHAREAGLGFVGKNSMLIRPGMGSYFFIATILLTLTPEQLGKRITKTNALQSLDCGECRKCLDACPTGALERPRFLNANKCLSYLSIEHRGLISEKYLPYFGETFYGCDICQEVCPYNLVTDDVVQIPEFQASHSLFSDLTLIDIARMRQPDYARWFGGTAMTRAKYAGLVRNALYSLWATRSSELGSILIERIDDENSLIREVVAQIKDLLKKQEF